VYTSIHTSNNKCYGFIWGFATAVMVLHVKYDPS